MCQLWSLGVAWGVQRGTDKGIRIPGEEEVNLERISHNGFVPIKLRAGE